MALLSPSTPLLCKDVDVGIKLSWFAFSVQWGDMEHINVDLSHNFAMFYGERHAPQLLLMQDLEPK